MAHRVRFSVDTLKVGPAGVDVLSATEDQLLFDAAGNGYNGTFLVGRLAASAFAESSQSLGGGGTKYTRTATVSFGKTFPSPPRVYFGMLDPQDTAAFSPNVTFNDAGITDIAGTSTGAALSIKCDVSTTQAVFTITYIFYSGSGYSRTLDVPYVVFQV